jgi:DNA-binding NtrC family response regulator
MANILVVDDEPKMTSLICGALEDAGHKVTTTTKPHEALRLIDKHSFDIVITDLSMPEISGMTILEKALQKEGTEVIMMTAYGTAETAVQAMKKGAADYLLKPFPLDELEILVNKLVEKQRLKSLSGHYQQIIKESVYDTFIGSSTAAQTVKEMIAKVAASDATVLLTGKSGTGKELAARMIHDLSSRKNHPFIAVNCAAITETLLESELFGHEKGAFTGAVARKRGRFELAEGGTIFLDEIAEMSPAMQTKLLRVLEEHQLVRVGGVDTVTVNVRVIAATNKNLTEEMGKGRFREDLFYRLNVFPIEMPNLIERKDDIIELAEHFLKKSNYAHSTLTSQVKEMLLSYDWPGNIRELKNLMERAVILAGGGKLTAEHFAFERGDVVSLAVDSESAGMSKEEGLAGAERQMILDALEKSGGNKTEAAKLLKITRRRLYSRMKVHGIES